MQACLSDPEIPGTIEGENSMYDVETRRREEAVLARFGPGTPGPYWLLGRTLRGRAIHAETRSWGNSGRPWRDSGSSLALPQTGVPSASVRTTLKTCSPLRRVIVAGSWQRPPDRCRSNPVTAVNTRPHGRHKHAWPVSAGSLFGGAHSGEQNAEHGLSG